MIEMVKILVKWDGCIIKDKDKGPLNSAGWNRDHNNPLPHQSVNLGGFLKNPSGSIWHLNKWWHPLHHCAFIKLRLFPKVPDNIGQKITRCFRKEYIPYLNEESRDPETSKDLINLSNCTWDKEFSRFEKKDLKDLRKRTPVESQCSRPFTVHEVNETHSPKWRSIHTQV